MTGSDINVIFGFVTAAVQFALAVMVFFYIRDAAPVALSSGRRAICWSCLC